MDVRTAVGYAVRLYLLALLVVGVGTVAWFFRDSLFAADSIATSWYAVSGMGAVVLVVLVGLYVARNYIT